MTLNSSSMIVRRMALCVFLSLGMIGMASAFETSAYAHTLTIVPNRASYPIAEPVADFPVLVRLSTSVSGFSYGDFALSNGGDLRFTDEHGTSLPFEIESWDESGTSLVWVQVPLFSDYTEIRAYWGNATPDSAPAGMWKDYVGVYHLDTISDGVTPDASANNLDLTAADATLDNVSANGKVGNSLGIFSKLLSTNIYPVVSGKTRFTVSMWVNHDGVSAAGHKDFAGIDGSYWYGFKLQMPNSYTKLRTYRANNTSLDLTVPSFKTAGWVHLCWVMDNTTQDIYCNGVAFSDQGYIATPTMKDGKGFCLGGFTGDADEARFYNGAYSASRAELEYEAFQNDFLTYGGTAPTPSATKPTVSIAAGDNAYETARTAGSFTISIPSALSAPLVVHYATGGRAVSGETYRSPAGVATIPAGETSVSVPIRPMNDTSVMWDLPVTVTLQEDAAYTLGSAASATITVVNDQAQVPTYVISKVTYVCPLWTGAAGDKYVDNLLNWTGLGPDGFYPTNCPAFAMTTGQTDLTLSADLVKTAAGQVQVLTDATFDFTGKELVFTNKSSSFTIGKNAHVKLTGGTVTFDSASCDAYAIGHGATFEMYETTVNHRQDKYVSGTVGKNATFILGKGAKLNAWSANPSYGEGARIIVKDGGLYTARGDSGMSGSNVVITVTTGGRYVTSRTLKTDYPDFTICATDGGTNAPSGFTLTLPSQRVVHTNAVFQINRNTFTVSGGARVELVDSELYSSSAKDGHTYVKDGGCYLISGTAMGAYSLNRFYVSGSNSVFEVANGADFSVNHNDFVVYGTNSVWRLTGANVTGCFPSWYTGSSTATCARVELKNGAVMRPSNGYAFGGIDTRIEIDGTSMLAGAGTLGIDTNDYSSVTVAFAGATPLLTAANTLTIGKTESEDPTVLEYALPAAGWAEAPVRGAETVVLGASVKVRAAFAGEKRDGCFPLVTAESLDVSAFDAEHGHELPRGGRLCVKENTLYLKVSNGFILLVR